jgi:endonuclease/exonuclease/phosphatase family metal-dependent hydrolase
LWPSGCCRWCSRSPEPEGGSAIRGAYDRGIESRPDSAPDSLRVLSYNLWHGRAQPELGPLIEAHHPDLLCLQEALASTLPARLEGMQLVVATSKNRLGVAVYANISRFEIESAGTFQLTTSRHDRFVGGTDHRLAAARLTDRRTGRGLTLGSFHATPFTDSNAARRRQVDDAHAALEKLGPGLASVLAGDFNHPILLFMLGHHLKRQGLSLARTATSTFHKEGSLMRGKFDVAAVSQLIVTEAVTLPQGASDHLPVLFTMRYSS